MANLPGFPEKRFERNGIGQRAGGAVQPLGGGWRACPTAAVAWQVHAAGSRPQDPSEAAGSGPESSVLRASAGERRLKNSRRCRWSAWRPTPPGTRYRAPFMPPFCLCKVCASRPRRAASASGSIVERASSQPSPAVVLERPRAAPAGSPGAGNLAQAPGNDVPQPAWPSGLFRVDPRLARLHWATSLT